MPAAPPEVCLSIRKRSREIVRSEARPDEVSLCGGQRVLRRGPIAEFDESVAEGGSALVIFQADTGLRGEQENPSSEIGNSLCESYGGLVVIQRKLLTPGGFGCSSHYYVGVYQVAVVGLEYLFADRKSTLACFERAVRLPSLGTGDQGANSLLSAICRKFRDPSVREIFTHSSPDTTNCEGATQRDC